MDKKSLKDDLIKFRDLFKEYENVVQNMWGQRRSYSGSEEISRLRTEKELPIREELTERLGRLEKYLRHIGVTMAASGLGRTFSIFDQALDPQIFDNPIKGESLRMAVQQTIKAVGLVDAMDERAVKLIDRKIPVVFVSYNFAERNKGLSEIVIGFLQTQDVAVVVGSEVGTQSVSEKVKRKIDDSDVIVGLLTKDEQDAEGKWSSSTWITQELAYSLANPERDIIRLIERGCETEGRMFGDREYIPFDRENLAPAIVTLAATLQGSLGKQK